MLGVEEAAERGDAIETLATNLDIDDPSRLEKAFTLCHSLGTNIESGMWVFFENEISKDYGRKFRQLQTSLRNEENYELRLQILNREMDALTLTKLSNEQLVPRSRKEKMEQSKKQFFEEHVRLESDELKGIVKTDQGPMYVN